MQKNSSLEQLYGNMQYGDSLWKNEEWCWSGVNESDEAGVGGEINFSSSYGCCVRYLWLDYCCDHQYWVNPKTKSYYLFNGYAHLSSGLACGLAGLSAGMTIGIVGDAGVRY
ncbi:hypothetical protein KY289_003103 [Solanum tuberosum]|nr:hypothetical protein KY289_003103 [Solanum tuberosum]